MIHTNLIVSELKSSGFKVLVVKEAVRVSLDNRRVSQMEVRDALSQKFEGIEFNLTSTKTVVEIREGDNKCLH